MLHLVEHDQPVAMMREEQLGLRKLRPIGRAFEVEHDRIGMLAGNGYGQRGLADLTRTGQYHTRKEAESFAQHVGQVAIEHYCILCD